MFKEGAGKGLCKELSCQKSMFVCVCGGRGGGGEEFERALDDVK